MSVRIQRILTYGQLVRAGACTASLERFTVRFGDKVLVTVELAQQEAGNLTFLDVVFLTQKFIPRAHRRPIDDALYDAENTLRRAMLPPSALDVYERLAERRRLSDPPPLRKPAPPPLLTDAVVAWARAYICHGGQP